MFERFCHLSPTLQVKVLSFTSRNERTVAWSVSASSTIVCFHHSTSPSSWPSSAQETSSTKHRHPSSRCCLVCVCFDWSLFCVGDLVCGRGLLIQEGDPYQDEDDDAVRELATACNFLLQIAKPRDLDLWMHSLTQVRQTNCPEPSLLAVQ